MVLSRNVPERKQDVRHSEAEQGKREEQEQRWEMLKLQQSEVRDLEILTKEEMIIRRRGKPSGVGSLRAGPSGVGGLRAGILEARSLTRTISRNGKNESRNTGSKITGRITCSNVTCCSALLQLLLCPKMQ